MGLKDIKLPPWLTLWPFVRNVAACALVIWGSGWGAHAWIDSVVSDFQRQITTVSDENTKLVAQMSQLTEQIRSVGQLIGAETEQRKKSEADTDRKLRQSEDSRRAEENGLVQRIDGIMSRIDTLVNRFGPSGLGGRGDITGTDATHPG